MKKYIFIHPDPAVLYALVEATQYHLYELRKRNPRMIAVAEGYEGSLQSFMGRADIRDAAGVDVLVTPGNSYGVMSGGFDLAVAETFPGIEQVVHNAILTESDGELLIGTALVASNYPLKGPQGPVPFTCYSPTMRVPRRLEKGTDVPYVATLAALRAIGRYDDIDEPFGTVMLPAMGHLTGGVATRDMAHQMAMAVLSYEGSQNTVTLIQGVERDRMIRHPEEYGFPYYKTPLL